MRSRRRWTLEQLETRDVPSTTPGTELPGLFAIGADAGLPGNATLFNPDRSVRFQVQPFGASWLGGVRVAVGDVDGDGTPDLITAAGPGGTPTVRVFSGVSGNAIGQFDAFAPSFTGGVSVSAADMNLDGKAEMIVSPDNGGGPRVRILSGVNGDQPLADFFGIADTGFRGGARVAVGDFNGDGTPDLMVGAGVGGGPRVAVYDGAALLINANAPVSLVNDFLVFGSTLRDGVNVTASDLNGDGYADLVFGGGSGAAPRIMAWDGRDFISSGGKNQTLLLNTFAYDVNLRGGARVTAGDLDGDGKGDVIVGSGPGGGNAVLAYYGQDLSQPQTLIPATPGVLGGAFVGADAGSLYSPGWKQNRPQISSIANQTIAMNSSAGPLSFSISETKFRPEHLQVTATSSDTTLIPSSGLVLDGTSEARSIKVTPSANKSGSASITLTVTDPLGKATSTSFQVNVTNTVPPNTPPTISDVTNKTVQANSNSGALGFTVSDAQTAAGSLQVTATSSNSALVSASGLVLGGSGGNRTITVTPAAGMTGTTTITLKVTDEGGLTATDTFVVTVPNTAPTISNVASQTVPMNSNTGLLSFTVSDAQTTANNLLVTATSDNTTLVPLSGIVLGGSGTNRTVIVTPALNQTGIAIVTLTVTDPAGLTAFDTFRVTVPVSPNTPPTISDVANQTIPANSNSGALSFTVSDSETAAGSLQVTASSNNTTLVPASGLVLGGSGSNRTITVTPASGLTGTATITLTVTDEGGLTDTDTFTVTVPNTAPTISNVADQSIAQGTSTGALTFTISDAQTSASSLQVTASSSNTTLVPASGLTLGGSGSNRTITVTPVASQSGTATITLTVTDPAGLTATDTFVLTVNASPNTPPTISDVANQTIQANGDSGALSFTVSDAQTAADSLQVAASSNNTTLVPASGLVLGGSGSNRTITVTPAAGLTGTATITLTVTDEGGLTASDTFTVTVPNTAPTISDVTDKTIPANGNSGAIGFTVSDAQTSAGSLQVTASSSNTTLVPASGLVLGGSGGNRNITITPALGQIGTATITLTVTDPAGLTDSDTFVVTVPNSAPTISDVADQTITRDGTTGALTFSISDFQTAAGSLQVTASSSNPTLVPASGLVLGGSGGNRTITVTPAATQTGVTTITLTVTDAGGLTATDTFTVSVNPPASGSDPQVLLTPQMISDMRQKAASNTPQWQAFKSRLDENLTEIVSVGDYQGLSLSWIADYALGYQVLKLSDPVTASKYADKAIALIKSALHDTQKLAWQTRQFLARGNGSTTTYTLPNSDFIPSTVKVYLSNVTTQSVTRGSPADSQDEIDYYVKYLKVSNTPDGVANYTEGTDWRHSGDLPNNVIDWSPSGTEPAVGATYYVTTTAFDAMSSVGFTLNGNTITLSSAPGSNSAIFVEYIYGTHAANGSTLAYQQTSSGDGGFNSIFIDSTYTSRNLGKYVAMGYDWLYDYIGYNAALKSETTSMLVRWSDYVRDNRIHADPLTNNYVAGGYVSRMFTAVALSNGRDSNGPRLKSEMQAYHRDKLIPALEGPGASLDGGFWAEGWNYGALSTRNILLAGLAYENAGFGSATSEHTWASEVIYHLVSAQPTQSTIFNGGDNYSYPAPLPGKDLYMVLAAVTSDTTARSYANYVIQNFPGSNTDDFQDLTYRNPSAITSFWSNFPLQYRANGTGLVTARADWNYNSTWLAFQLGNPVESTHQSFSPGHIQIQHGGDDLLTYANAVGENLDIHTKSSFANLIAIDDNGEGAQNYRWNMGFWYGDPGVFTTAYEATVGYMYVAGDYHAAYSLNTDPGAGGPASELTRQVVYLRPDYVVIHDRATTTKASYPKRLQWHFLNNPTVTGNTFIETVGASKLFGHTFSSVPLTTTNTQVTVGSGSVYRVASLPTTATAKIRYTTALQTATSSTSSMVSTSQLTSTDSRMEGVRMADQVVLFGTDGAVNPATAIQYAITGAGTTVSHLLTDMQAGRAYTVKVNGTTLGTFTASSQGTLSFSTTGSGNQTINVA